MDLDIVRDLVAIAASIVSIAAAIANLKKGD